MNHSNFINIISSSYYSLILYFIQSSTYFNLKGSPFFKFLLTFFPKISFKYLGCIPKPGLIERTLFSIMTFPFFISSTTNNDLENSLL